MRTLRRILAIGGPAGLFPKASGLGLEIVNLRLTHHGEPEIDDHCSLVLTADLGDLNAVTEVVVTLHRQREFDQILALTPDNRALGAYLTDRLGLPGISPATLALLTDRYAARTRLEQAGLPVLPATLITSMSGLEQFLADHPVAVVRPREVSAGLRTLTVDRDDDLAGAWRTLSHFGVREAMAEAAQRNPILRIETLSGSGSHRVIAITSTDVGAPASDAAAVALAQAGLDAIGLADGYSYVEIARGPDGLALADVGQPTVSPGNADLERLIWEMAAGTARRATPAPRGPSNTDGATITPYEDGPLLVRGDFVLQTPDGRRIDPRRATVALCRCGSSALKPFCDGTHKATGFRAGSITDH